MYYHLNVFKHQVKESVFISTRVRWKLAQRRAWGKYHFGWTKCKTSSYFLLSHFIILSSASNPSLLLFLDL